jgi:hypothetical protein
VRADLARIAPCPLPCVASKFRLGATAIIVQLIGGGQS